MSNINFENLQKCIFSGFDNEVCGSKDAEDLVSKDSGQNMTSAPVGFFKHSEDEKNALIRRYLAQESEIKVPADCAIGVGYNMCTDINFKAVELINLLEPKILSMEKQEGKEIKPIVHAEISTLREFIETFAYQFMHGANSERVSKSRDLFYLFLDSLRESEITRREEIGGHSAVWALRAQIEGCKVYAAAQTTPVIEN